MQPFRVPHSSHSHTQSSQVFNLDTKTKLKAYQMPTSVEFWKWITPTMLGLVTATSVFHWDIEVGCC